MDAETVLGYIFALYLTPKVFLRNLIDSTKHDVSKNNVNNSISLDIREWVGVNVNKGIGQVHATLAWIFAVAVASIAGFLFEVGTHREDAWGGEDSREIGRDMKKIHRKRSSGTDGEKSLLCDECTSSRAYSKIKALTAILTRTIIGPVTEVYPVKILDVYGLECAIPSICRSGDKTHAVI